MDRRLRIRLAITVLGAALVAACDGGGEGGSSDPAPGRATHPAPWYVDVAKESGVTRLNTTGRKGVKEWIYETNGPGAAWFDADGDGDLDLFLPNGRVRPEPGDGDQPCALYRNDGNGRFTDVTAEAGLVDASGRPLVLHGMSGAPADFDNDGDQDLFYACWGENRLFENDGSGKFTDVTDRTGVAGDARDWSTFGLWFDYDQDGRLDLYVTNYLDIGKYIEDMRKDGVEDARTCDWKGIKVYCGPRGLPAQPDRLYHNEGGGVFREVSQEAGIRAAEPQYGFQAVAADLDLDGDLDIYVANDSVPNYLWRNEGDGTFVDVAAVSGTAYDWDVKAQASMGLDIQDFDNDGRLDLVVTNFSHEYNTLYRNVTEPGAGLTFEDVSSRAGLHRTTFLDLAWGVALLDWDHDGWRDLAYVNGHVYAEIERFTGTGLTYYQRDRIFRQNPEAPGTFEDATDRAGPGFLLERVSRGAAFADVDNDGDLDILVVALNDRPVLLRQDGEIPGRFLQIATQGNGTTVNRDGIGARVRVVAGDLEQVAEQRRGGSFLSVNDPRLHFGLGTRERVDRVEVRWPDGTTETWSDLETDHAYRLVQGRAEAVRER